MATFTIGGWRNLTEDVVMNILLYGQETTPKEIFDRIVLSNTASDVVELDMASFVPAGELARETAAS